jgi:adenylosuccinate synthase
MKSDIVIGLQYGDEGKGKVVDHLIKNGEYTCCVRYNGGPNAGHTVYFRDQKLVTHQVPTGAIHGFKSLIGSSCMLYSLVVYFLLRAQINNQTNNQTNNHFFQAWLTLKS